MMELCKILPEDLKALQKISRETFIETFGKENTEEDLRKYLEEDLGEKQLLEELMHRHSHFFFSLAEGKITGYMKLNEQSAQTEKGHENAVELQRIYVYKEFKGRGIGKFMMESALSFAVDHHAPYLWLGVWEKNTAAISFYEKLGFVKFSEHVFLLGEDAQTDYLMKKEL